MYSCSTVQLCFGNELSVVAQRTCISKVWQSTCDLSLKVTKDVSQKSLVKYFNVIQHYGDTTLVHPNLLTG